MFVTTVMARLANREPQQLVGKFFDELFEATGKLPGLTWLWKGRLVVASGRAWERLHPCLLAVRCLEAAQVTMPSILAGPGRRDCYILQDMMEQHPGHGSP